MPVTAIVGAGPGLGAAAARRFGREGFSIALIARDPGRLEALRRGLVDDGIETTAHAADVRDRGALVSALESSANDLGEIDVIQYSPVPSSQFLQPVLDTTVDDLTAAIEFSVLGPVTAIEQVLPGMLDRGRGTVLFVNGSSAVAPNGNVAGTSVAFAAESAYAALLHDATAPQGLNVRQLIIPGAIGGGDPKFATAALAEHLWNLHATPGPFRVTVGEEPE